jgi:Protein of unknown function (DUF3618)
MTAGSSRARSSDNSSRAELAEDIERTREQLAETVEALVAKTDVKTAARRKASHAWQRTATSAQQRWHQTATAARRRPAVLGAGAAAAVVLLASIAVLRWRRR